jgi:hypothetical protein
MSNFPCLWFHQCLNVVLAQGNISKIQEPRSNGHGLEGTDGYLVALPFGRDRFRGDANGSVVGTPRSNLVILKNRIFGVELVAVECP